MESITLLLTTSKRPSLVVGDCYATPLSQQRTAIIHNEAFFKFALQSSLSDVGALVLFGLNSLAYSNALL